MWAKAAAVIDAESSRMCNIYNTYKEGHYGLMQLSKSAHPEFFKAQLWWIVPYMNTGYGYTVYKNEGWGAWQAASEGRFAGGLLQATAAVASVKSKRSKSKLSSTDFYASVLGNKDQWLNLVKAGVLPTLIEGAGAGIATGIGAAGSAIGDGIDASGAAVIDTVGQMQSSSIMGAVQLMIGAGKWLADPANWLRVGQVVVGGGLLLAGVSIMAKPVTSAATSAATSVIPATRAIKKVAGAATRVGKAA
jgi:hypothetical protein